MQKQVGQEVPATGHAEMIVARYGMVTWWLREEEGSGLSWEEHPYRKDGGSL